MVAQRQMIPYSSSPWKFPIGSAVPVNVAVMVYVKDRRRKDLLNLMSGVLDVLVRAEVLADDSWEVVRSHDGSGVMCTGNGESEWADVVISEWKGYGDAGLW